MILNSIRTYSYIYEEKDNIYWTDKEFVLRAVKIRGYALRNASKELTNHKNIVIEALKNDGFSLIFASKELEKNKNLIMRALKNIYFVNYIKFKKDRFILHCDVEFNKKYLKKFFDKILKFY